ncbi:MAG: hypothetical protein JXB62_11445 [Pirellulales bacterium]|nr:hypothetical protein [Pirellulales bacterium]
MTDSEDPTSLTDREATARRLTDRGLSPKEARRKAVMFAEAATALSPGAGGNDASPLQAHYVPGRIEVLGKHTDYAGGSSMVVAAERGFCLVARACSDRQVVVTDVCRKEAIRFGLDPDMTPRSGHWSNYPMTVARRVARNFPGARRGAEIALASDLPCAAGMSSSSAMIVGFFAVLSAVNTLPNRPEYRESIIHGGFDLAGYLATVENGRSFKTLAGDRGVGTLGGSEDHTAILFARPGRIEQFSYCPVTHERSISLPAGQTFAVGVSGVVAEKTGAARDRYNTASQLAAAVAAVWQREAGRDEPHLAAALAGSPDAAARLRAVLAAAQHSALPSAALSARLEHFIAENTEIIPAAGDALAHGHLGEFGRLVDRSQRAAEDLLGNQVPETSYLAVAARERGAVAASAFGAGFGGSVWAMVETARAEAFLAAWAETYRKRFPRHAESSSFFVTRAGPAAMRVL